MDNKPTVEELLRQQLELLAERSVLVNFEHLAPITLAMVEICKLLNFKTENVEEIRKALETSFSHLLQGLPEVNDGTLR